MVSILDCKDLGIRVGPKVREAYMVATNTYGPQEYDSFTGLELSSSDSISEVAEACTFVQTTKK